ncbi:MAG: sugar ABC transporter permease [Hungatella sp.]
MNAKNMKNKQKTPRTFKQILCSDNVTGYAFAAPFIIGFLGFTVIPMIMSLYYSMTDYNLVDDPNWVGLFNYVKLFTQDDRFWNSIFVTLKYVVIAVPLKLTFALMVAFFLTRKSRVVSVYRAIYYLPSLIGGSVAVALVWKQMFSRKGLINSLILNMGFDRVNWLGDERWAIIPLILMTVWQFGSSMIIFAAGLKEIPSTYYEAAQIDGAGTVKSFFKITLPCLSPIILFNLVMQTISGFMVFTQSFVITQGGPNDSTNFLALYIYNNGFGFKKMGYASAMSWILLIVIATVTLIIFKVSKRFVFSEASDN